MGDRLAGRYRLDRRLGQGGMGEVWRGHDLALDRPVAVKVLLGGGDRDRHGQAELVARFRREATIGARLQHPGITVVHDVGQEDGRLFIVMELLAGEDLATLLAREGTLPVELVLDLGAQTAEALAAAHEQAVVHRDLKPANLFLLPGGRLKICDFGIAHSADVTAGWTVTGRPFGTPPYMAPEQWRGERVGARCDLYALGCVLYALLSGEPPFGQAEGPYVLMLRHIEEEPVPLRRAGVPVSPQLERLVLALLAKDPADRPESAEWVGKTLRSLGSGAGAAQSPAGAESGREPAVSLETGVTPGTRATPRTATGSDTAAAGTGLLDRPEDRTRPRYDEPAGPEPSPDARPKPAPGTAPDARPKPAPESAPQTAGGSPPGASPTDRSTGQTAHPAAPWWRPGGGGVPAAVGAFVRDLVREAEAVLPAAGDARPEVLAAAADAAARFDADLALRLLADAEHAAWTGGAGDGARVARLLTGLAHGTAPHAPARARRLLNDAQQALFTVPGPDRRGPLRAVAEELVAVAPEQAAQLTAYHFADGPAAGRLRSRIDSALAATDPRRAERDLERIGDPARRAAATYDLVVALAPRDLMAALRLSERIGSAGGRLLALCQLTQDRAAAGDAAGAARALAQAEEWLPHVLEERAAWLREEAARFARLGQPVEAERLRSRADGLLRGRPEAADGDEKAGHALAWLEAARNRVAASNGDPPDPARARESVERARRLPDPAERARELARIARACVAADRLPWLPQAAAAAGSTPSAAAATAVASAAAPALASAVASKVAPALAPTVAAGSRPGPSARPRPAAAGEPVWSTGVRPQWLARSGDGVVWRDGAEVGRVTGRTGAVRWSAYADEGTPAPALAAAASPARLSVDCLTDAGTVCVLVRRDDVPGVRLLAREPHDGRVRWWRDLSLAALHHLTDELVVLHAADGPTALYAATGDTAWEDRTPKDARHEHDTSDDLLTLADDLLVVVDGSRLRALRTTDGAVAWDRRRVGPGGGPARAAAPLRPAERLVHVVDGDVLRALTRRAGLEAWQFELGVPAPRVLEDRGLLYAAAQRPDLGRDLVFCLDAATGRPLWQRSLARRRASLCGLDLLGVRSDALYVRVAQAGQRGLLHRGKEAEPFVAALDARTGRVRGQWADPAVGRVRPVLLDDLLVVPRPELMAVGLP
ncbi:protein kinase [Streptomyces sp. NPDC059851]|uniref:protein kinase domain-containing protein n=1 Tax=Streptomyces sp. NPDC059851 TaxID=3346971 RepID=UPI003649999C